MLIDQKHFLKILENSINSKRDTLVSNMSDQLPDYTCLEIIPFGHKCPK